MEYNYTHGGDVYRNPIEYDFSIRLACRLQVFRRHMRELC